LALVLTSLVDLGDSLDHLAKFIFLAACQSAKTIINRFVLFTLPVNAVKTALITPHLENIPVLQSHLD